MTRAIFILPFFLVVLNCDARNDRKFEQEGFSIALPDGFTEMAGQGMPGCFATFINGDVSDGKPHMLISLQMLRATLAPYSHLSMKDLPQTYVDAGFKVNRMTWNDHLINIMEGNLEQNGTRFVTVFAQIPLAPKALQVNFMAPLEEKAAMYATAREVVSSVVGQSNWDGPIVGKLSNSERAASLIGAIFSLVSFALFVAFLSGIIIVALRSARKPKSDHPV